MVTIPSTGDEQLQKAKFDPGLTQQYGGPLRRAINNDGTFNVIRRGTSWRDFHPYLQLVSVSWATFFALLLAGYTALNVIFASVYYVLGPHALKGGMAGNQFLTAFYFSSQTLTTVGFGSIAPNSHAANLLAAFEALIGLLGFAVATGLLFGRVSRPSARIGFSERALIAPYQEGASLQFRVVNRRENSLIEPEARVLLMTVERNGPSVRRNYTALNLERPSVLFLPLTWTVVHPIDSESPLWNKTAEQLVEAEAELLILIKAWDETFSQTVHQRYSYRFDEIIWNARFTPAFTVGSNGDLVLDVGKVGDYAKV